MMNHHPCFERSLSRATKSLSRHTRSIRCQSLLRGPPADYDFRADIQAQTVAVVRESHPELLDLVQDGTLVVYTRPVNYVERRTDGYREPEVVYLVGTAHVSTKSAQDVQRVIQAVQPENVVVELCKSRAAFMADPDASSTEARPGPGSSEQQAMDAAAPEGVGRGPGGGWWRPLSRNNPFQLGGGSFVGAMQRSMRLGGQNALLLRFLLASQAGQAASQLGVQPGAEFRAARRAGDAVGASLVLGDRPIEITLERAWEALSWQRRTQLCRDLSSIRMGAGVPKVITADFVEEMKTDDAVSMMFKQMSEQYPELVAPLLHERDVYLAWSLKRSKAVNGTKRVVGVVGKGHMRGVVYAMMHDNGSLRFADLVGGKNTKAYKQKQRQQAVLRLVIESIIAAALYIAWTDGWLTWS